MASQGLTALKGGADGLRSQIQIGNRSRHISIFAKLSHVSKVSKLSKASKLSTVSTNASRVSQPSTIQTTRLYEPKSLQQRCYVDMLEDALPNIVVAHGPAGSGKTKLAVDVGMWKLTVTREVDRIVLTRPTVPVENERHGFLPGTLDDKMRPWLQPVMDAVADNMADRYGGNAGPTNDMVMRLIKEGRIEFAPLAFMRGRTFRRSWVICDEAQNCTPTQLLMVMTRLADDSKLVITGDLAQHDSVCHSGPKNGLVDLLARLRAASVINHDLERHIQSVAFSCDDVQRSQVVKSILQLYPTDNWDESRDNAVIE
jgi:phosphate starvation-inducible protein PhoH and related proteins